MANVLGGTSYGAQQGSSGYGGSGYGGSGSGNGYSGSGNYGNREEKKKAESNNTYNYGNTVGHFGDYTYEKSTLDKYKDPKQEKPTNGSNLN